MHTQIWKIQHDIDRKCTKLCRTMVRCYIDKYFINFLRSFYLFPAQYRFIRLTRIWKIQHDIDRKRTKLCRTMVRYHIDNFL